MRAENQIFKDLSELCQSPGYIHALAILCFRNTAVGISEELKPHDLARLADPSTLIRTELNTLYGLMINGAIDTALPTQEQLSIYVEKSCQLLEELHNAISAEAATFFKAENIMDSGFNPFASAAVMREPIFYAAESAYPFQYRDLAHYKYQKDTHWLLKNKSFDIEAAQLVSKAMLEILSKRLFSTLLELKEQPTEAWTILPGFTFSCAELADITGLSQDVILECIDPFCVPTAPANAEFTSLHAFNKAYALPIIRKGRDEFVILQPAYGYSEAIYDAPFYWMGADKEYCSTAMKHRGDYAENFAYDRLVKIFGSSRVFKNVEILRGKAETLAEIDVLVVFGDRLIVLQAKSKKLTLSARNGNDLQLKGDFKSAVQDAVDQAYLCASLLIDRTLKLRCRDGVEPQLTSVPKTIFPLTVVSDHYPALAFQAKQFLNIRCTETIVSPLVTDVFTLDAISEMLSTPLRFLSYIWLRAKASKAVFVNHEMVTLSYHLQHNLWVEPQTNLLMLDDSISIPLDVAMAARREGIPGRSTPEGLLTKFCGTRFDKIVTQIEKEANPRAISLGFALMELGEASIIEINRNLAVISSRAIKDGKRHDFSLGTDNPISGITFHTGGGIVDAEKRLYEHCKRRKYIGRAELWHGVVLTIDGSIKLVATLSGKWEEDLLLEAEIARTVSNSSRRAKDAQIKLGRNMQCPCGSGKKWKKCCLSAT